jgi:hypothetical protein
VGGYSALRFRAVILLERIKNFFSSTTDNFPLKEYTPAGAENPDISTKIFLLNKYTG